MELDVLIFGGQSNMQGQTEGLPRENLPVDGVLEYRLAGDELIPLRHPVGETISGPDEVLLRGSVHGSGALVPDFCRAYVKQTGIPVVAIHAAKGSTGIGQWLPGQNRYIYALEKLRRGIEKARALGTVRHIYYIWLQGETDAIRRTSKADYMRMLTEYKNSLKQDAGIEKFGIIEVGYFCYTVRWLKNRTREEGRMNDEAIMAAQEALPEMDSDFVLLTQICKTLSLDEAYINPFEDGHYNNRAMTVIGETAGTALAALA